MPPRFLGEPLSLDNPKVIPYSLSFTEPRPTLKGIALRMRIVYVWGMSKCFNQEQVAAMIEEAVGPLRATIAQLEGRIAGLQAEVDRLRCENARLRKDSSTSSKPPSSDIVKPKKALPKGDKRRRKGGQPGHDSPVLVGLGASPAPRCSPALAVAVRLLTVSIGSPIGPMDYMTVAPNGKLHGISGSARSEKRRRHPALNMEFTPNRMVQWFQDELRTFQDGKEDRFVLHDYRRTAVTGVRMAGV